jgi:hypothetical protein
MVDAALFSSGSDKWATPPALLRHLEHRFGGPFYDPCPIEWKPGDEDGLALEWKERNFVNPPYSEIAKWAEKSLKEYEKDKLVLFLCPARTDTKYFHKYLIRAPVIYFIEGRLRFNGSKNSAPFPSMIAAFGPSPLRNSGVMLTSPILRTITRREIEEGPAEGEIYKTW